MRRYLFPLASALMLAPALGFAQDARLTVSGDDDDLRDALEAASVLLRPSDDPQPPADIVAAARAEYRRLIGVLYDQGYFAGVISVRVNGQEAAQLSPFAAPGQINSVEINVDPGRPFTFGTANIAPVAGGTELPEEFTPGGAASTGVMQRAAQAGIDGWRDEGHATAEVADQRIIARNRDAQIDADIRLDPGPRLNFGNLNPDGQERMPAARVVEIAGLPTGETFSPAELNRAANRLRRTGVFSSVALTEGAVNPDGTIDIDAEVVEAPLRRLGFGAELSSVDGIALSAYWLHRNLTGGGERLRFDAEVTEIGVDSGHVDWRLAASFSRPATATPDTTFQADAEIEFLDEDDFDELVVGLTFGIEQQISDTLVGTLGVGIRFSDISDAFGERQITLLTLPSGLTYDRRNDELDPTGGYYASLDLTPFYGIDSGEFGLRSEFEARGYLSFGAEDSTTLAARVQLGSVYGGTIRDLPPGYLFYSGGGGTVRGQDYNDLGAIQDGRESGGRGFIGLSGEIRQDITDTIGLVAFYDAGYVSADPIWDDSGTWHSGAGLGLRYATPFGAIRLDVAVPVDGPTPSNDFYLYIGIGQSF
ncbi:BamA/TamA family outer membrane protein [Rhodobacterales bacterium HKCCE3408]|nr:BamA/TamA family outer membrane protein [Rhodobacterales bacterium HKCCE3408]